MGRAPLAVPFIRTGTKKAPTADALPAGWDRGCKLPSDRFLRFCEKFLVHVKGESSNKPVRLAPWQIEHIIRPLFDTRLKGGRRQYRICYLTCPRKQGKGLALDTPLPTPHGWTTIGEVKPGDELFDEAGQVCRVQAVSEVRRLDCYAVTFSNGERIIADGDHLWLTTAHVDRPGEGRAQKVLVDGISRTIPELGKDSGLKATTLRARLRAGWTPKEAVSLSIEAGIMRRRRWQHDYDPGAAWVGDHHKVRRVRSTRELAATATYGKRGDRNHSVMMPEMLDLPEVRLPIDPYVLGAWLGDGNSANAYLSCGDQDVEHFVQEIRAAGYAASLRRDETAWRVLIQEEEEHLFGRRVVGKGHPHNLQKRLRALGILKAKRIPGCYLRASAKQRLALLQGLMDTDGTSDKSGNMQYTSVSAELAVGVAEVLASLGIKYSWRRKSLRCNRRDVPGVGHNLQFVVTQEYLPIFRLPRKLARQKFAGVVPRAARSRTVQIVSVEPVASVPTVCLAVDSPSHLFRVGRTMLPTHNSTLGAAIALYLLYADSEGGADIISAAGSVDQANVIFSMARMMVERSAALRDMTGVYRRELIVQSLGASYRVISAEAGTAHGLNLHGAIVDELHVWPDRRLYDALVTSTGGRSQPLVFIATTAGDDEHGICAEVHRHAEQVRDGLIADPQLLPVIFAAPEDADPWDEAVWRACNPALGTFRSLEEMRAEARRAQQIPGRESPFRRLYLNQWGTEAAARWLPLPAWDACQSDDEIPDGATVFLGLDLSANRDLTALVLLAPDGHGGFTVKADFWCPADSLEERARNDRVPYPLWAQQGFLHPTPGNTIDDTYVAARIDQLMRQYDVVEIAFDPWNAKGLYARWETDNLPVVAVPQTMANLTSASKALEQLVLSGRIRHDGHPILRWCVRNAVADTDGNGNLKPSKKRSHERIDGVAALVTGLARAMVSPSRTSVYEARGVIHA